MLKQFISFLKGIFGGKKEVQEPALGEIINDYCLKDDDLKELFVEKTDDSQLWVAVGEESLVEETPTKVEEPVEVKQEETPASKPKRKYNRRKKATSTTKTTVPTEEKPKRKYTRRSSSKKSEQSKG